jgi:Arc/MetJ-type ribon-helix-helix transcriptional regulator
MSMALGAQMLHVPAPFSVVKSVLKTWHAEVAVLLLRGQREYCLAGEQAAELPSDSWALWEAEMDRDVLDVIEREIDQEVRARFPGTAVRQAVLLQYGDDPLIEPGDLWVRVLLDEPDEPEDDWGPLMTAFQQANETAIEQFRGYTAAKLREIMAVEYVFANNSVTYDGDGPRCGMPVAQRLSDIQEWEHGEATFVLVALGPAGLETVDTLIIAGIAASRAEAIRWSLDRVREQPAYQRLRELRGDAEVMDRDALDTIEREINEEARARFPRTAVRQAVLLQYGDDPEIGPGDLWVRVLFDADGPEDYEPTLTAFLLAEETARLQFAGYLAEKLPEIRLVEYTFSNPNPVTRDGHGPRVSNLVGERPSDIQEREHGETTLEMTRLGPAGLETLDTLIMTGTAATRAEAIRWALDRVRERPAYQRLHELRCEADRLKDEFSLRHSSRPRAGVARISGSPGFPKPRP